MVITIKTRQDIDNLVNAGLNQIGINVYFNRRREFALLGIVMGLPSDRSLFQNIGARGLSVKVIPKYHITRNNTKLPGVDHISNRAGNIPDFVLPLDSPLPKMCTRPFRFLNINWQGEAMLCCNDYYVEVEVGNVDDVGVVGAWNSTMFNIYRLKLQNKNRQLPLCGCCDFAGGYYPHMIHPVTFSDAVNSSVLVMDLGSWEGLYECVDYIFCSKSARWS